MSVPVPNSKSEEEFIKLLLSSSVVNEAFWRMAALDDPSAINALTENALGAPAPSMRARAFSAFAKKTTPERGRRDLAISTAEKMALISQAYHALGIMDRFEEHYGQCVKKAFSSEKEYQDTFYELYREQERQNRGEKIEPSFTSGFYNVQFQQSLIESLEKFIQQKKKVPFAKEIEEIINLQNAIASMESSLKEKTRPLEEIKSLQDAIISLKSKVDGQIEALRPIPEEREAFKKALEEMRALEGALAAMTSSLEYYTSYTEETGFPIEKIKTDLDTGEMRTFSVGRSDDFHTLNIIINGEYLAICDRYDTGTLYEKVTKSGFMGGAAVTQAVELPPTGRSEKKGVFIYKLKKPFKELTPEERGQLLTWITREISRKDSVWGITKLLAEPKTELKTEAETKPKAQTTTGEPPEPLATLDGKAQTKGNCRYASKKAGVGAQFFLGLDPTLPIDEREKRANAFQKEFSRFDRLNKIDKLINSELLRENEKDELLLLALFANNNPNNKTDQAIHEKIINYFKNKDKANSKIAALLSEHTKEIMREIEISMQKVGDKGKLKALNSLNNAISLIEKNGILLDKELVESLQKEIKTLQTRADKLDTLEKITKSPSSSNAEKDELLWLTLIAYNDPTNETDKEIYMKIKRYYLYEPRKKEELTSLVSEKIRQEIAALGKDNRQNLETLHSLNNVISLLDQNYVSLDKELVKTVQQKEKECLEAQRTENKLAETPQTTDTTEPTPVIHLPENLAEKLGNLGHVLTEIAPAAEIKADTSTAQPVVIRFGNKKDKPDDKPDAPKPGHPSTPDKGR